MAQIKSQGSDDYWLLIIICGQKRVGGREMLKASGGNVKCLGNGEKSWGNVWWNEK